MMKRPMCLLCLIFMAGIWLMSILGGSSLKEPSGDTAVEQYLQEHSQVARIYGSIYRRTADGSAVYLKNSYLKVQSEVIPLENVIVYMDEEKRLTVGAGAVVMGKMERIPKPRNPGQFDSALYYEIQHIRYRMTKAEVEIVKLPKFSYREVLASVRDRMADALEQSAGGYSPVFQAILLGDKSQLEDETKDRYQMAGILHMLAISGMHLSLLGMGCFKALQKAGASIPLAGSISVALLFSYGIFTGESVSTMRALFMFVLIIGAKILGRSYDLLTALAFSAVFILIDSPFYLYYSGFQLSFGSVCGIAVVRPAMEKTLGLKKLNPSEKDWKNKLLHALNAGVSIQIATLPVTMYSFYEVPVYGIWLNLLVIPTLGIVLVLGIIGGIAGMLLPAAGRIILFPGCILLRGYDLLGSFVQKLPYTTWVTGQPDFIQILVYYLVLGIVLKILTTEKIRDRLSIRMRIAGIIPLISLLVVMLAWRDRKPLQITCIDVGQGDCISVSTETGSNYLIDGGSSNIQEVGRYRILPYLKSQGISRLDYVWVSHSDSDHISGILEILELQAAHSASVKIDVLVLPDWEEKPDNYVELEEKARAAGADVVYVKAGDVLQDGELQMQVLAPLSGGGADANEDSEVLLLSYGDFQGLFTGDIGFEAEEKLYKSLEDVDFLKAAHHGSKNSTGEMFLKQTKPEIAVISSSSTNTYGHPHPDTLERLEEAECRVWCTKDEGAVTVCTDGEKMEVESFLDTDEQ